MTPLQIVETIKLLARYDSAGDLFFQDRDGDLHIAVNCNDLFEWACADCEFIEAEDYTLLKQSLADSEYHGDILWAARKRGMRPQGAYYKHIKDDEVALFDACGPQRDREGGFNTPKPSGEY